MKYEDLCALIESVSQDIDFEYFGLFGSICPFKKDDISLCYDGHEITVTSVYDAMHTPFIGGKALYEVCEDLKV